MSDVPPIPSSKDNLHVIRCGVEVCLGIRGRLCHPHACQDPECSQHGPEVPSLPSPAHGCSMALAYVRRDGSTWPLLEFYTLQCEVLGAEHLWSGGMAFRFSRVLGLPFAHRAGMHRKVVTFFLSAERDPTHLPSGSLSL